MKEKILQALKAKFKNLGFGDKAFDGVATFLAITITEEENIETGITGVEGLLKGFQGDADGRVNQAVAKAKLEAAAPKPKNDPPTPTGGNPEPEKKADDEVPSWAKGLVESYDAISKRITAFETGQTADSRKQILESKLKDANPKFKEKVLKDFARMKFEKDEDFDAYVTETEADLTEFSQSLSDQGLGGVQKPFQPQGANATKTAAKASIEKWSKANAPAEAAK